MQIVNVPGKKPESTLTVRILCFRTALVRRGLLFRIGQIISYLVNKIHTQYTCNIFHPVYTTTKLVLVYFTFQFFFSTLHTGCSLRRHLLPSSPLV